MTFNFQQILDLSTHQWFEAIQQPESPLYAKEIEQMLNTAKELANEGFIDQGELEKILKEPDARKRLLALREEIIKGAIKSEEKKDPGNLKSTL